MRLPSLLNHLLLYLLVGMMAGSAPLATGWPGDADGLAARFGPARLTPVSGAGAPLAGQDRGLPAAPVWQPDDFVYIPATVPRHRPATVLVTLHGMGGEGRSFCRGLLAEADRNGWIVLAPTLHYDPNWHDPAGVVRDDVAVLMRLTALLDTLPARTGLTVRPRVLLLGFSRGAQVAHRFALAYPERVRGVAIVAAGAYTLPVKDVLLNDDAPRPLPLPYGTADLARTVGKPVNEAAWRGTDFWIGVGENDTRASDVPAAWTPYLGPNRVTRARAFKAALDRLGIPATLVLFPRTGHTLAPEMTAAASRFLGGLPAGA